MSEASAPLLLDTCALIWIAEDAVISEPAAEALNSSYRTGRPVYVSPISAWEVGMLISRGRLACLIKPQLWFRRLLDAPSLQLAEMSPDLLITSSFLPGTPPRDPADRIIAATVREFGYRLMTRDRLLLDYAEQGHIQVLIC
jgi:PIN domain nuclease of toxin-antitoxin system